MNKNKIANILGQLLLMTERTREFGCELDDLVVAICWAELIHEKTFTIEGYCESKEWRVCQGCAGVHPITVGFDVVALYPGGKERSSTASVMRTLGVNHGVGHYRPPFSWIIAEKSYYIEWLTFDSSIGLGNVLGALDLELNCRKVFIGYPEHAVHYVGL